MSAASVFATEDLTISLDDLIAEHEDWKYGHGKATAITRSTLALVSVAASALLVRILSVSPKQLTTTYHRLLLGMSIGDIVYSLGLANFNSMAPADVGYRVWNARGNQATCDAMGSLLMMGIACSLAYSCSINLFYLAKIRYNKSDAQIRDRIEPWLHGVPVALAIAGNAVFLVGRNLNTDSTGTCFTSIYDPPHCDGYEDGDVRDGFEIPCGRGGDGFPAFSDALRLASMFVPPVVIGTSLGMIYRDVWKAESRVARYGLGELSANHGADDDHGNANNSVSHGLFGTLVVCMKKRTCRKRIHSASDEDRPNYSNSRAVMHRALAYSTSYFITWIWPIVALLLILTGIWETIPETGQLIYRYFWIILNPLQGFFNLLIFMHPQVVKEKHSTSSGEHVSWRRALARAFWSSATGAKNNGAANNGNADRA